MFLALIKYDWSIRYVYLLNIILKMADFLKLILKI